MGTEMVGFREEDVERQDQDETSTSDSSLEDKNKEFRSSRVNEPVCDSIKKWEVTDLIQLSSLVPLAALLIATLVINKLENTETWEVELWRTCVFVLVIFCGNIISRWLKEVLTFLIVKSNHYLKSKFVYLIYVIMSSSTIFIWLGLIMVVWLVLIRGRLEKSFSSEDDIRVLRKITRAMVSTLAGILLWFAKTYIVQLIESSFHMSKFFGRVQDAIFYDFVVQQLEKYGTGYTAKKVGELEWDYVEKLYKTVQGEVNAIYMTQLIEKLNISEFIEITSAEFEEQSKTKADNIVTKLQHHGRSAMYVDRLKLKEALQDNIPYERLISLFGGDEDWINVLEFRSWMIEADKELRNLAGSLKDSKTAIDELSLILGVLVGVVIGIVWLLVMGAMTTEMLVFISSQLLVWSFIFSDTFKTLFEGIIFNFVAHPLDIGDECIIEDKKMVVEEMGLLSTNFQANEKKENGENEEQKIHYSNAVLAGLRIINLSKTSSKDAVRTIWEWKKEA